MIDDCGITFERLHSNYDTTCFEPPNWHSDLYYGLGGPYYYTYDPSIIGGGTWHSKTLTYYNSAQYGECGIFQSFVGLNEPDEIKTITVSPNPVVNTLKITTELEKWNYTILSSAGKILKMDNMNGKTNSIDVSSLNSGYYFLLIIGNSTETIPFVKY
jgi:hypothetical protein